MKNLIEIMAPISHFDSLNSAIQANCDSVYFGIEELNMRANSSKNFRINDLKKLSKICKENNIKCYLTLNTIIYDDEINVVKNILIEAKKNKIDAIIAHDMSVLNLAKDLGLNIHISTQANISNIEAVKYYSKFADVVVLARELSLDQIKNIAKKIKEENIKGPSNKLIKIEAFVHGALCVAISGKCYMSLHKYNTSANRGKCLQACRRKYRVIEEETNKELIIDNKYVMSPKDLCTIANIDKLIEGGIQVFKIEGRAKSTEYIYTTVKCYKEATQAYFENTYTKEKVDYWLDELKKVFNRGFWMGGYYLGKETEMWTNSYGSQAKEVKIYIGKATNYFSKINVGEFIIHSHSLSINDDILIIGNTTGSFKTKVITMQKDKEIKTANKGDLISIKLDKKIRKGDKLYLVQKVKNA
ncbi:MAG: putative protease YdcP [Candidatus Anoxychlamydiales bacterium]|nr:putative protease YdcP [Candidatus Anoxychlamydiales bacterium]